MLVRWRTRERREQYKLAGSYRTPVKMSRPPEKRMCECGMAVACVMRAVVWQAVVVDMCEAWRRCPCVCR